MYTGTRVTAAGAFTGILLTLDVLLGAAVCIDCEAVPSGPPEVLPLGGVGVAATPSQLLDALIG